jgi:hypothetical protein
MRRSAAAPLLAAALALACGKRGDPLPPIRRTPQPVVDLRIAQRGDRVEVSFTAPRTSTNGARLPVLEAEILRAEGDGDFQKVARPTRRKVAPGERIVQEEPLPPKGTRLRVAVRTRVKSALSTLTPVRELKVTTSPPPPSGLTTRSDPKGAALSWVAPEMPPSPEPSPSPETTPSPGMAASPGAFPSPEAAAPPTASPTPDVAASPTAVPLPEAAPSPEASPSPAVPAFFIYRRSKAGDYGRPLVAAPTNETAYVDTSAAPGDTWCYSVRVVSSTEPLIESAPTDESCLDVKDVAPPAPPVGVAARETEGGIEISWSPSTEPDLAVYRVYRWTSETSTQRIAEVLPPETTFLDTTAPAGVQLRYAVSAVDKAGNESQRAGGVASRRP